MVETAVLLDMYMKPLYWHVPVGATSVSIPDSRTLWNAIWRHRHRVHAIAHTHPGSGVPAPSMEDLTTFAAVEDGLGARLAWWIATSDHVSMSWWAGPSRYDYSRLTVVPGDDSYEWLAQLRKLGG